MIAQLTGNVVRVEANNVILDVNGVGYRVSVPLGVLASLPEAGGKVTLHTTMHVAVNTMEFTLYGFASPEDQHIFQIITSVSGVGAKIGLSMLSMYDGRSICRAISANDTKALSAIPGIGPKLASRICLELGERLATFVFEAKIHAQMGTQEATDNEAIEDAVEALVNLGYSRNDARKSVERITSVPGGAKTPSTIIREALNLLSTGGKR
ncbi:MAG: Holliday junction branch migration protein RuvA [Chthonomonadales bacterium]